MGEARVGVSASTLRRRRQAESDHPADIARREKALKKRRAKLATETDEEREARLEKKRKYDRDRKARKLAAAAAAAANVASTSSSTTASLSDDIASPGGTSESALKRPGRDLVKSAQKTRGIQPSGSKVGLKQSSSTSSRVKRKLSECSGTSRGSGQPAHSALKRTVKEEKESSDEDSSDDEDTKYMTDKEKSLKQIIEEFKGADVMALQDALVTCKWDVCETRAYLLENPPRRMAPNPYRNAQFNIFPSSRSRDVDSNSEEEGEVTPQETVITRNAPPMKNTTSGLPNPEAPSDTDLCNSQKTVELLPANAIKVEVVSDDEEQIDGDVHGMTSDTDESDEEIHRKPVKVEPHIITGFLDNASSDELVTISVCQPKVEAVEENRPHETWKTATSQRTPEDVVGRKGNNEEFILPTGHVPEHLPSSVEKQINPGDFVAVEIKESSSQVLMAASLYATALQQRLTDERERTRLRHVQPL
ncbi:SWI/SNF-related matrix-associated actin-dependent regulator of chromatin subfamily A containing DEAD/H box 1A-like isoform X1 [Dermacentor albipictus]|uniref:SWI/SNF-related matrix-associated actin-dependent regulator of chromatin subfamily A containing DEAD/H box 1A-like isoform X1 n=1 Tax=Dermacentor albipictus TaxID=60249 RepID=UPI0038FC6E5E